jgi:hypothetical protein
MSSDSAPFAEGNFDPALALELEDKFSTADALDIEADDSEPPEEIWGGLRLAPGQLMEIIGGSGLGKSRDNASVLSVNSLRAHRSFIVAM